jgi:hypothetical protein
MVEQLLQRKRRLEVEHAEGVAIGRGVWDTDLDAHPEMRYVFEIGQGFKVSILRTCMWTWNGYLIIPEAVTRVLTEESISIALQCLPFPITFRSSRGVYGIDHCTLNDLSPLMGGNPTDTKFYTTFEQVVEKLKVLAQRFGWSATS